MGAGMGAGEFARRCRILCGIYLAYLFLRTLRAGLTDTHLVTEWTLADWLINYQAGFVRRGLTGQIIFGLGRIAPVSPILLAMVFAMVFYAILFYAVWRLLRRSAWNLWVMAALCSPATLSFPVLDATAGFHKEIIFLAALGLLLVLLRLGKPSEPALIAYLSFACTFCILSHESLAFYLPYLFSSLAIYFGSIRRAVRLFALPALLAGCSFFAVLQHRGNAAMAEVICAPLRSFDPWICGGSIGYLGRDQTFAHQSLLADAAQYHYATVYSILAVLSLLPVFMGFRALWKHSRLRPELKILAATAVFSFLLSLALFWVAADWGRWIYIHVVSLFLILLFIDSRHQLEEPPAMERQAAFLQSGWRRSLCVALLLLYATAWDMPNYGNRPIFGYMGQVVDMLQAQRGSREAK